MVVIKNTYIFQNKFKKLFDMYYIIYKLPKAEIYVVAGSSSGIMMYVPAPQITVRQGLAVFLTVTRTFQHSAGPLRDKLRQDRFCALGPFLTTSLPVNFFIGSLI